MFVQLLPATVSCLRYWHCFRYYLCCCCGKYIVLFLLVRDVCTLLRQTRLQRNEKAQKTMTTTKKRRRKSGSNSGKESVGNKSPVRKSQLTENYATQTKYVKYKPVVRNAQPASHMTQSRSVRTAFVLDAEHS